MKVRKTVRVAYGGAAKGDCCGPAAAVVCDAEQMDGPDVKVIRLGHGGTLKAASVQKGETVLDLGSGTGGEILEASKIVGPKGRAIGVDATPEMIFIARENADKKGLKNVEFRLGEIEHLPIETESVDVVISDCVVNLSPDKQQVFREAHRVLRAGGRIVLGDVVAVKKIPEDIRKDPKAWAGCVAGAVKETDYIEMLKKAGFRNVKTVRKTEAGIEWLASAIITAEKTGRTSKKK